MVQRSRFWDGTSVGDATVAPYDAGTEFAEVMIGVAGMSSDPNKGGVLTSLSASMFVPGTLRVGPFEALVYGTWYQNDANTDFVIATPAAATRIDTVVLRKSWAAQTVRILILSGVEGGSAPPLVQTVGVTWDIPIARVSTTTGGVSTVTPTSYRADMWYRTSAASIRTDSNVGVGVTPVTDAAAAGFYIQVGASGQLFRDGGLSNNSYYDGISNKAIFTGPAVSVTLNGGMFAVYTAPSVAAAATQAFGSRLHISTLGCIGINAVPDNLTVMYVTHPGTELSITNASAVGFSVGVSLGRQGGTGGNLIAANVSGIMRNNGTSTGLIAGLSVGISGTNPGTTAEISTFYVYTPSVSGGTVSAGTYVIKHGNTIACLNTSGVWTSASHEFAENGSRWKQPTGEGADAFADPLAVIRAMRPRRYDLVDASVAKPERKDHLGFFAEELYAISPFLSRDGKGADPLPLLALYQMALDKLLARIEVLEGKVN